MHTCMFVLQADCLLETQAGVLDRFRDGIMAKKKPKKVQLDDIKEEPEDGKWQGLSLYHTILAFRGLEKEAF